MATLDKLLNKRPIDSCNCRGIIAESIGFVIGGLGAIALSNCLIPWANNYQIAARISFTLLGESAIVYALGKAYEAKDYKPFVAMHQASRKNAAAVAISAREERFINQFFEDKQEAIAADIPLLENSGVPPFNVQDCIAEATGGIGLLGNSGSGKTTLALYIAAHFEGYQILVLDPHDDPENSQWHGLTVIRDYAQILQQLELLLQLLTNRDKVPLVVICDEFPAVRMYAKKIKSSVADDYLLRQGSEGRKFNKMAMFCSQSGNTKALGLEGVGDFLENFTIIRLQKVAIKYARYLPDQTIFAHLKSVAYGMLVQDDPFIHPTHGHHLKAFKGAVPLNLKPLVSMPLTIPLVGSSPQTVNVSDERLNHRLGKQFRQTEPSEKFSIARIESASERLNLLRELKAQGANKEDCIWALWQVKKGGSTKYQMASKMYDEMLAELGL